MKPWAPSENADVAPVTKENILATTTTATALKSPTVHAHMFYPNTPTSASMLGELDNANHIPDSDKYISKIEPPITQFPYHVTQNTRVQRFEVSSNGTLIIHNVLPLDRGQYLCNEMKVHVKVVADVPVIANKTNNVIRVLYGESVSLQCSAKGEPTPLILWFSPTNRAITSGSDKYFIHDNGTVVIEKVQRFDGGNYICLARNSAGQDRKVTRVEIIVSPPAINGLIGTTNSMRVSSVRDQRKLIDCETTGTPVPHVMWVLPENVVLPAPYYGSRMTVHRNGTLDIRSVRMADTGQLACIARNEGGETKLVFRLDVTDILEKPKLKSPKMESLLLTVGRTINLNCSFEGSPTPQLTWILLNGSPLLNGTLVISNPALSEAGTYRCLGRNAAGMVERTVTLMPGHKPEINNRYNSPVSIMNGQKQCPSVL
uniref:Matrix-remodeling-associated protein 5-like n=1 Tax=Sinocyclocheilus rhinocerous TaxID=307959 RepID=A0A673IMB1_9TELE